MEKALWGTLTCSPWLGMTVEHLALSPVCGDQREGVWWPPPHTWDRCHHHKTDPKSTLTGHTGSSSGTGKSFPSSWAAMEVTSASSQMGSGGKNAQLLLPYLCRTGEFHFRAVCFVNWNIFLLFKHIPWHFPALMSASLQLSCFLSLLIFYLTSQTTKQPSTLGASLQSLCSHSQPSELSSRLQQTAWEQGFRIEPHSQSLTPEHRAGARSSRDWALFPSLSMCLGTFWEAR